MNSNKRKMVEQLKTQGLDPKEAYDAMRAHEKKHGKIIGKRKPKKA